MGKFYVQILIHAFKKLMKFSCGHWRLRCKKLLTPEELDFWDFLILGQNLLII